MGLVGMFVVMVGGAAIYLLPAIVALNRAHPNGMPIFIVNLFFGWTLLGWVICLAWAFSAAGGKGGYSRRVEFDDDRNLVPLVELVRDSNEKKRSSFYPNG